MNEKHYSMLIQWSNRDHAYIVTVLELPGCRTHGEIYTEAVDNGIEAIEAWIEDAIKDGDPLPEPRVAAWQR